MIVGFTQSPCKGCEDRTVEPNCHNPEICQKWKAFREKLEAERLTVHHSRSVYASEAKQLIDSCRRNKFFQSKRKK